MMGERVGSQDRLFYDFCLEDVVPADHFLRKIDAVLELSWLRGELAPYYSHLGCEPALNIDTFCAHPPYKPVLICSHWSAVKWSLLSTVTLTEF